MSSPIKFYNPIEVNAPPCRMKQEKRNETVTKQITLTNLSNFPVAGQTSTISCDAILEDIDLSSFLKEGEKLSNSKKAHITFAINVIASFQLTSEIFDHNIQNVRESKINCSWQWSPTGGNKFPSIELDCTQDNSNNVIKINSPIAVPAQTYEIRATNIDANQTFMRILGPCYRFNPENDVATNQYEFFYNIIDGKFWLRDVNSTEVQLPSEQPKLFCDSQYINSERKLFKLIMLVAVDITYYVEYEYYGQDIELLKNNDTNVITRNEQGEYILHGSSDKIKIGNNYYILKTSTTDGGTNGYITFVTEE